MLLKLTHLLGRSRPVNGFIAETVAKSIEQNVQLGDVVAGDRRAHTVSKSSLAKRPRTTGCVLRRHAVNIPANLTGAGASRSLTGGSAVSKSIPERIPSPVQSHKTVANGRRSDVSTARPPGTVGPEANRLLIGGDTAAERQGHVTTETPAAPPSWWAAGVEVRSIDEIPLAERHGRVRDQFTLWFGLNANIFVVVLGGVAVFLGLNLLWAGIAIVGGTLIGLVLVGFHAIQGPKLGVPQMIQSRGQFGFYGAVLVFAASIVLDVGFLAAQLVIQADAMNLLVSRVSVPAWIAILVVPVVVLTVFGYDWIHRFQRVMTPILAVTFLVVLFQAVSHGAPTGAAAAMAPPSFPAFMAAVGLFVVTVVSWAPYVSDYSRYLPPTVNLRRTFAAVTLGIGVPTVLCAFLGAYLTSLLPDASSTVAAIGQISGRWVLPVMAVSLIGSDVVNSYTGMLAAAGIVSCFRTVRRSITVRVAGSLLVIAAGTVCALLGHRHFVGDLSNFLGVLLYVLIPWSAINLVDYYLVQQGDYDVPSFFTPAGRYGGVLWPGWSRTSLAVAVQVPFIEQTFYTGSLVRLVGGVDISWIIGGVAGVVFYLLALRLTGRSRRGDTPAQTSVDVFGR